MNTSQLVTLLILGVLVCTTIALLSLFLLGITLDEKALLEKQLKNKCPEYEKVENVYKIR